MFERKFFFLISSIYSHQGHQHTGSYQYKIETNDGDSYSFISVDLCPRPGIGRPFNLLGYLSQVNSNRIFKRISFDENFRKKKFT